MQPHQQQQQIQTSITQGYNQLKQQLDLEACDVWRQVLLDRDWTRLQKLRLQVGQVGGSCCQLVGSMYWPNLKILELYDNNITSAEIIQLLKQNLPKLQQLTIKSHKIGDVGIQILTTTPNLPKLKELYVINSSISWMGMTQMPNCQLSQLQVLSLGWNKIGRRGIQLLVKADLKLLEYLEIQGCQIGEEGARQLTKGNWPNLLKLDLGYNNITFGGSLSLLKIKSNHQFRISTWCLFGQQDHPIGILNLLGRSLLSSIGKIQLDNFRKNLQQILQSQSK